MVRRPGLGYVILTITLMIFNPGHTRHRAGLGRDVMTVAYAGQPRPRNGSKGVAAGMLPVSLRRR
jgi:hypothetical protein